MPSRLPLGSSSLWRAFQEPYICPSCCLPTPSPRRAARLHTSAKSASSAIRPYRTNDTRERTHRHATTRHRYADSKRHASHASLASATAINAPSTVPAEYRELHQRLVALQETLSGYVDLARLQLAVRSLESSTPVIRVALLGLGANGALAARKLARVLLSDPLNDEEAWEREILQSGQDGRSLLVRYGDVEDVVQQSPLTQNLHVPSPFLKRLNVEILVTTLNADRRASRAISDEEMAEAILVPPLTTPNAGGRVGFVRYPVHKALVVAEGIAGAVEYGRLPRFTDQAELIGTALSLPLRTATGPKSAEQSATDNVVDSDLAAHGLEVFRASKANGAQFSDEWQASRMPSLTQWLTGPQTRNTSGMHPTLRNLLNSILSKASNAIDAAANTSTAAATAATIPETKRALLNTQIDTWARDAHRDLQTNLTSALASKTWRRTAWFRLLWRIDDVSASASDILRLSWLTEAEQSLAYLSGRITEAGLATPEEMKNIGVDRAKIQEDLAATLRAWEPKTAQVLSPAELLQTPRLVERVKQESGVNALFDPPWPQTIHLSRQQLLHTLVPAFHRKAQALVLRTLSTIGGTTALGTWLFVATGGDVFAGGSIAALGFVWSLRRLQTLWGREREGFEGVLREDGRGVLGAVEGVLRGCVREGGRARVREVDEREWRVGREALRGAREEVEKVR
ncbi:hypothetical protein B0A50_03616 [Salinomyces thailandicus]|uniref:Mmc1 C-terminal domain-containing protein n=1 Tax=Salinomyces thailandicus TaxID=706561 RepID=A0A4U0U4X0_9PEZI|nr:hypothetical protein B0A50_03616 [Salinomyces thailandica]